MNDKELSAIGALRRCVPILAKASPFSFFMICFLLVATGLISGAFVPISERFFNALEDVVFGNEVLETVYFGAFMLVGVTVLNKLVSIVQRVLSTFLTSRIVLKMDLLRYSKIGNLSAKLFEDPEFLTFIKRTKSDTSFVYVNTWLNVILSHGSFFVIVAVYLLTLNPMLLLVYVFTFGSTLFYNTTLTRLTRKYENNIWLIKRQELKYAEHVTDIEDTRRFGVFEYFHKLLFDTKTKLLKMGQEYNKKILLVNLASNSIRIFGWIGTLVVLFISLMNESISVGAFAAVLMSVGVMFSRFENAFNELSSSSVFLNGVGKFIDLIDMQDKDDIKEVLSESENLDIVADNIYFSYPKSDNLAVKNVSLTIKKGQTVAIDGENGCGKSTLVKILCGLYPPDSGVVYIAGQDTSSASPSKLFSQTSAVFQEYITYDSLSLDKNVRISNFKDNSDIQESLKAVSINNLHDINTLIGREFGGIQLSTGQMQRLAIARGLFRKHEFIFLDEPTASVDPLEESRIYQMFADYTKEKTAIIVTHRLASARIADIIIVMKDGEIVETGNHDELLQNKGHYSEMWQLQSLF